MGMAGAAKGAAASSPVQVGMPCGWGAPGPSPVMPVPRAHTPNFQLRYRVPQAQLSLAHAGEACGEDMTLAREDGPHGPHSLVGRKPLLGWGETGRGVTQLPAPNYSASWGAPAGPRPGERLRPAGAGSARLLAGPEPFKRPQRRIPRAGEVGRLPAAAEELFPARPRPGRTLRTGPVEERARAQRGLAYRVPERELPLTHPAEAGAQ